MDARSEKPARLERDVAWVQMLIRRAGPPAECLPQEAAVDVVESEVSQRKIDVREPSI